MEAQYCFNKHTHTYTYMHNMHACPQTNEQTKRGRQKISFSPLCRKRNLKCTELSSTDFGGDFLPEAASITVEIPLRSETGRDDPGMLTGSERTGWILQGNLI